MIQKRHTQPTNDAQVIMKRHTLFKFTKFITSRGILFFVFASCHINAHALVIYDEVLTQGSLIRGFVGDGTKVELNGQPVRISHDGHFVIGFGRDANLSNELTTKQVNGVEQHYAIDLEKRDYKIQHKKF